MPTRRQPSQLIPPMQVGVVVVVVAVCCCLLLYFVVYMFFLLLSSVLLVFELFDFSVVIAVSYFCFFVLFHFIFNLSRYKQQHNNKATIK